MSRPETRELVKQHNFLMDESVSENLRISLHASEKACMTSQSCAQRGEPP